MEPEGREEESVYKSSAFLSRLASCGPDVAIFRLALMLEPENITVGEGTRIDDFARIEGGSGVTIGRFVHIASFASILGGGGAEVGDFAGIAQGARIITGGGHPSSDHFGTAPPAGDPFHRDRARVALGAYAFVAANAVVLPRVVIGEGAVVAAGAVTTRDVPPWTVVAGAPAKPIGVRPRFVD